MPLDEPARIARAGSSPKHPKTTVRERFAANN